MPAEDFKSKISIDVTDWKTGVATIRRDNRLIESGFQTVAAGLDNWRESSEGLSERQKALNQKIANQKEIVSALDNEYKNIVRQYGKTSYEAENFEIKLNREKTALAKSEKELRNVSGALKELETKNKDAADSTDELADKQSKLSGILQTASPALVGIAGSALAVGAAFIMAGDESASALNDIRAATGASADEMDMYKSVMDGVVSSNFGDGFEDVAKSISLVQQQVEGLNPAQLESFVENSYLLEDTFGMDLQENIRGVNALVKEFGLSNDEAFNLMAQGAQNGLNQNQDLADQMAEYAPLWADLGFSAEETFNALVNGSKEGAYQIDFLNDAVKEFGIRTKDNSDTTRDAFEGLGLDADALTEAFANGGEGARQAFSKFNEALFSLDDATKRNELGVALYGTKFEDLGEDAIRALSDINGEISLTNDALSSINEVKYDSIGDNISLLKNQFSVLLSGGDIDASALGNTVTTILSKAIGILTNTLPSVATAIVGALPGILEQVISFVVTSLPTLVSVVVGIIPELISAVLTALPQLIAMLSTIVVNLLNALTGMLPDIINQVIAIVPEIIAALLAMIPLIVQAGIELLMALIQALPEIIEGLVAALPIIINSIISTLVTLIPMMIEAGIQLFIALIKALPQIITSLVAALPKIISALIKGITTLLPLMIQGGIELFIALIKELPTIITEIVKAAPEIINALVTEFSGLGGLIIEVGTNLVVGIWDGINGAIDWICTKLKGFGESVLKAIKTIFGIASPSKKTTYFGEMLGVGVAKGIDGSLKYALASAKTMTRKTLEVLSGQSAALRLSQEVDVKRNVVGIDEPSINALNSIITTQSNAVDSQFMGEVLAILKTILMLMQSGANITDTDILRALDLAYKKRGITQGGLV